MLSSVALSRPTVSVGTPAASPPDNRALPLFRRALLRWYDAHRRDLPWRRTRDPYRIWLSEIMLQQTRVAAVLDHYRLFLKRFPSIRALAAAPESAVLAAWSGLGYYRRARMLHQCARKIVAEHASRFPQDSKTLRSLPGIGRYTAAAIASIAFGEATAVVDGNVERALGRIVGHDLASTETWQRAQKLLSPSRPGDFNQAMMELGATVCTPSQPRCPQCPIRKWCAAQGELLPRNDAEIKRQTRKEIFCALHQRDGHIRLVQRPANATQMPGMWELPQLSGGSKKDHSLGSVLGGAALQRCVLPPLLNGGCSRRGKAPKGRKPSPAGPPQPWRTFRHSITTTDYTVHVIRFTTPVPGSHWVAISKIPALPITGLTRKILRAASII